MDLDLAAYTHFLSSLSFPFLPAPSLKDCMFMGAYLYTQRRASGPLELELKITVIYLAAGYWEPNPAPL